jgi:hypothetical protein
MFRPFSIIFREVLDEEKLQWYFPLSSTSLKMAETCRRTATCLYIIVCNYNLVAGIYTVNVSYFCAAAVYAYCFKPNYRSLNMRNIEYHTNINTYYGMIHGV